MWHYVGWQWVAGKESKFLKNNPRQSGYNVYAPVMYKVGPEALQVIQDFSHNIGLAKKQGYEVWLTFQQFGTSPNLSDEIITAIIEKALEFDVEGINIDFEGLGEKNRQPFTDFIAKLFCKTKAHQLLLSVDVVRPAISMYSLCYDRGALAQVCDYLVLMAYDQHWATSPQEGSVAELGWTEESIKMLLAEDVPADKLILAVPFYSRNWQISTFSLKNMVLLNGAVNLRSGPSTDNRVVHKGSKGEGFKFLGQCRGDEVGGNARWYEVEYKDGSAFVTAAYSSYFPEGESRSVSSVAIGMQACLDVLSNYDRDSATSYYGNKQMSGVEITFDKRAGQKLVTYLDEEGALNKIWLEDGHSLAHRHALAQKYKLAGVAAWSLEWMDEEQEAWQMMLAK